MEGCNISFKYNNELRNHLETLHKFENIISNMDFSSFKEFEFEVWLEAEELEKDIRICRSRGVKRFRKSNLEKTYFDCSRLDDGVPFNLMHDTLLTLVEMSFACLELPITLTDTSMEAV